MNHMKNIYPAVVATLFLTACSGTKEYDSYVATLAAQPAVIDTISSTESYGAYIESLQTVAEEFEALSIKLDKTQRAEIDTLSRRISKAAIEKYISLLTADEDADSTQTEATGQD